MFWMSLLMHSSIIVTQPLKNQVLDPCNVKIKFLDPQRYYLRLRINYMENNTRVVLNITVVCKLY